MNRPSEMTCPGCGEDMDIAADPIATLGMIQMHTLLCAPPGVVDVILAREGSYTTTFSRWVGRQIEAMVRDDVQVV